MEAVKLLLPMNLPSHGIPVYITDQEAKKLMQSDTVLNQIREEFGETVFENGDID